MLRWQCKCKCKGKVKLSLCFSFNWAPRHEGVFGEWRYSSIQCLTSALDGGEWSASSPGRFTPRERGPGTHWIGGWVGPRAILDAVMKRKIPSPRQESKPRTPIIQFVAQRYTDWAITALDGRVIILKWISTETVWEGADWIELVHVADQKLRPPHRYAPSPLMHWSCT
jgi:hypothetical protein